MIRPIMIQAVLNGFKVTVGCQEIVFETIDGMMTHLYRYLQNPEKTEMEFLSSPAAFNAPHTMPGAVQVNEARNGGESISERVTNYRRSNPVPGPNYNGPSGDAAVTADPRYYGSSTHIRP